MASRKPPRAKRRTPQQQIQDLEARIAELRKQVKAGESFSPDAVRADRERLELTAAEYAELVGVSPLTIYSWEHGRTKPRPAQLESWLAIKGMAKKAAWDELGYEEVSEFSSEAVLAERERLELSARDYGALVGVSMLTIYNWEKGKSVPRAKQLDKWLAVKGIGKRGAWKRLGL